MNSEPKKPINEMDLAELKTQRSKRLRRKTEIEEEKKKEEIKQRRLEEANKIHKQERIRNISEKTSNFFSSTKVKRLSRIIFYLAILAVLGSGFNYWYTHPNLSESKLLQSLKPITVQIQKKTGVKAEKIVYTKTNSEEWKVEYFTPKNFQKFNGRRLSENCEAVAYIDIVQSIPIDKYRIQAQRCR